jgi:hypothetical protein
MVFTNAVEKMRPRQISSRNAEAERIAEALGRRLVNIVPSHVKVTVANGLISVVGVDQWRGNTFRARPAYVWLLPLPPTKRLRIFFESYGKDLQNFLSRMQGSRWPSDGATTHVSFIGDTINVWWGGPRLDDAAVQLLPISQRDIRLDES